MVYVTCFVIGILCCSFFIHGGNVHTYSYTLHTLLTVNSSIVYNREAATCATMHMSVLRTVRGPTLEYVTPKITLRLQSKRGIKTSKHKHHNEAQCAHIAGVVHHHIYVSTRRTCDSTATPTMAFACRSDVNKFNGNLKYW